jgi:phosphatidylserine/phosphatidylglycerophosphate/cardiolipin synthase-like enzyme
VPLFDPVSVERIADVTVTLADPLPSVPVQPPVAARFAGHQLRLLQVRLRQGVVSHDVVVPTRASVRRVALDPATPLGSATELLEISPLPFNANGGLQKAEEALRSLPNGVPTFYVSPATELSNTLPGSAIDDAFVEAGTTLATMTPGDVVFVGVLFQDGIALSLRAALAIVGDALDRANDASGAAAWRAQLAVYASSRTLHVLRHHGAPFEPGAMFDIELRRTSDDAVVQSGSRALGMDSDLESSIAGAPIGTLASLHAPPPGHYVAIRWKGEPLAGEALPVHALYETGDSAEPGAFFELRSSMPPHATLQMLELANWYPELRPGLSVARYHTMSRVEPLVDGIESFSRFVEDAKNAMLPLQDGEEPFRLHLASWKVNRFELDPRRLRTDIVEIAEDVIAQGGSVLVLQTTFVNIKDPTLDDSRFLAILILVLLNHVSLLARIPVVLAEAAPSNTETDNWVEIAWFALPAVVTLLGQIAFSIGPVRDWAIQALKDFVDESRPTVEDFNDLPGLKRALFSINPARIDDNPLAPLYGNDPLLGAEGDCDQFNVYHNKVQMVRRRADARGDEFVGYLGGIDVNANRFDSPGHQIGGTYHDVHARITGPAVADVFTSFYERYARERERDPNPSEVEPAPPAPIASQMPDHDERHIARIGRTYPLTSPPYDFARNGDRTIYDTLLAAIAQAREYIYIEEQYFTPDDAFVQAVLDAGAPGRCKRLLIVLPTETDQHFGDIRRREVLAQMRAVWGDRMRAGFLQRRPLLARTDRFASRGRTTLVSDCGPGDGDIWVAFPARVTVAPFWLWIDGELMLARDVTKPVQQSGTVAARIAVERGAFAGSPRWGAKTKAHRKGSPVTFSQVKSIFVHAKCMMIDDVFVSIGSANLNRRGFFSDGEINVFAIPEQLRSAPDNPARALRAALWAEHLGIPPAMGASLLRDPIAACDRFSRSHLAGNRFTPLDASDVKMSFGVTDLQILPMQLILLAAALLGASPAVVSVFFRRAWNLCLDPTTRLDPAPEEGPV